MVLSNGLDIDLFYWQREATLQFVSCLKEGNVSLKWFRNRSLFIAREATLQFVSCLKEVNI